MKLAAFIYLFYNYAIAIVISCTGNTQPQPDPQQATIDSLKQQIKLRDSVNAQNIKINDSLLSLYQRIPYSTMAHQNSVLPPFESEDEFITAYQEAMGLDQKELNEFLAKNKAVPCDDCDKKFCRGFKWEKK